MGPALSLGRLIPDPYYCSADGRFVLYQGDSLDLLARLPLQGEVAMAFADPPYFLSNGGITCHGGRMAPVNKGAWDRGVGVDQMHDFNRRWLGLVRNLLAKDGALWVSGTRHVIFSAGFAMQQLGYRLLNEISWEKPNPPPNLACRTFTHSTETLIWASREQKSKHYFDYAAMREQAGGKQMKSVWKFTAPGRAEKAQGAHPTQKPLALLERIVLATSRPDDLVLDPFSGSGTTGLAAARLGRRYVGIEMDQEYLDLAIRRFEALAPTREGPGGQSPD
jgi:site-specific DNA-methyltransferase (adenine-specific)